MSLYHYGLPNAIHQFSDNTERHKAMAGVMRPTKRCSECGNHKPMLGSTRKSGKFVCADCKKPFSMFSALLLGEAIKLPKGKARKVTFKTPSDRENSHGERERLENIKKVRNAIKAGNHTSKSISIEVDLSVMTVLRRLEELIDLGDVVKNGKRYELRQK